MRIAVMLFFDAFFSHISKSALCVLIGTSFFCFLYPIKKQIQVVDYQNVFRNLCTTLLFAAFFLPVYGANVIKNLGNEQISDEKIIFFENFSFQVKKSSRKFCSFRIIP